MVDLGLLQCPTCRGALRERSGELHCPACAVSYPLLQNAVPVFVPATKQHAVPSHKRQRSSLRRVAKNLAAPHHSLYFGSFTPSYEEGKELQTFLQSQGDVSVLNIGSLSKNIKHMHPGIINLDIAHYASVDVVGDAHALPFRDGCVDVILFKNVLEHIRDPDKVMEEIWRVLKPGGTLYIKIPFLQPFHAVPDDFQRYTVSGIRQMLKEYEELNFDISVGPGSMLSWMLREWLAVLFSRGNMTLYQGGLLVFGWLTFWIKYTDFLFLRNPLANRVTSAFVGFYRKPAPMVSRKD